MKDFASEETRHRLRFVEIAVTGFVAWGLILTYRMQWTSASRTEIFGFITGGICVWLGVRRSIWTWPFGLANNLAFFRLFWFERLYADAFLQVIFFCLSLYGWWSWLRSEVDSNGLTVLKTRKGEWLVLIAFAPFAIWGLRGLLVNANGASPFWDASTSVLSLAAQFLMCRKRLETWLVWIVADAIYVPLYLSRGLPLTAVLYFVFLLMCVAGWFQWRGEITKKVPQIVTGIDS